jgi:hypothetical protein
MRKAAISSSLKHIVMGLFATAPARPHCYISQPVGQAGICPLQNRKGLFALIIYLIMANLFATANLPQA